MMLRTAGVLLKKEAREIFSDFTRTRKTADIPGKLLTLVLAAVIVAFTCFVLKRFASMYIDIEINDDDLKIDTYRSSGAGGQHINKTSSAVRITHLPTGIVVQCQNERSQHMNKDKAMQMLKSKLYLMKQQEQAEKMSDIRGEVRDINFGNQIRSYVMQPYTLVKDHRTNTEVSNVNAVMDGNIDPFINAYLSAETGKPAEEQ